MQRPAVETALDKVLSPEVICEMVADGSRTLGRVRDFRESQREICDWPEADRKHSRWQKSAAVTQISREGQNLDPKTVAGGRPEGG